jgi:molybdopterin synthase catalytic subunit
VSVAQPLAVEVRLFAMLRERAGAASLELQVPAGTTVAEALTRLARWPELAELVDRLPVATAVNREYVGRDTVLCEGDELALIPPVSGGAPEAGDAAAAAIHASVAAEPLSSQELSARVGDPRAGAIVVFQGVTREIAALDYEAYAEMAIAQIEAILRDCVAQHGLCAAAAAHRVGRVALGEPSVVVAVSAPHREEAFAGARAAIDAIKAQAPIWKRERDAGGEGDWVAGAEPHQGTAAERR